MVGLMEETVTLRIYFYKGLIALATITLVLSFMEWGVSKSWAYFYYFLSAIMILESLHQLGKISLKTLILVTFFLLWILVLCWVQNPKTTAKEPFIITLSFVVLTFIYHVWVYSRKRR